MELWRLEFQIVSNLLHAVQAIPFLDLRSVSFSGLVTAGYEHISPTENLYSLKFYKGKR